MKRRELLTAAAGLTLTAVAQTAVAQTVKSEAATHPRIAKAIRELEDASGGR